MSIGGEQAQGKSAPKKAAAAAPKAPEGNEAPASPKTGKGQAAPVDEAAVASNEGVVPADAGTEATAEVDRSTQNAAPAKAKAKKTPKA